MRERTQLAGQVEGVQALESEVADTLELIAMAEADNDTALVAEGEAALRKAAAEAKRREIESLLSGEADGRDAFLEVNAGAGGTEAQDWAEMLARMYTRWAEARGYKMQMLEQSEGEQAGIKSATFQITGPNAYGWLKTEGGVHRLVRISPFDSAARRQTSFASIYVYPVIDDTIHIEIDSIGPEGGHLPRLRRRRTAREQDRVGDPYHPRADRDHRRLPDRPFAAPQPCDGDGDAARSYVRGGVAEARGGQRADRGGEDRDRLGPPDPVLRAGTIPDGEGPADRAWRRATRPRCWTARWTISWPPPWPPASGARAARRAPTRNDGVPVHVGIGGWTFAPWRGPFYPPGLIAGERTRLRR